MIALLAALHALAAVVWVGGMSFAHFALRPSLPVLESPQPLRLWQQVFPRFFRLVWTAIVTLLATGYGLIFTMYGSFAAAPLAVHLMQGTGLAMMGLFVFLFTRPYARFRAAAVAGNWPEAAKHQAQVRGIVHINLYLGLATVALGASGRFW
ncbi:MAG: CopD family protein [Magnetospirillum sp. WYHS-4]